MILHTNAHCYTHIPHTHTHAKHFLVYKKENMKVLLHIKTGNKSDSVSLGLQLKYKVYAQAYVL